MQSTLTGLPLLAAEAEDKEEHREKVDSKRSYEQDMEPSIVDHVIHNFLSARGEAGEWGTLPPADQTATSLSDLDTGISFLGDSTMQSHQPPQPALHRRGCPTLRSIPPPPSSKEAITTAGPQWSCTQPWAPSSWRAATRASTTTSDTEAWRRKGSLII